MSESYVGTISQRACAVLNELNLGKNGADQVLPLNDTAHGFCQKKAHPRKKRNVPNIGLSEVLPI